MAHFEQRGDLLIMDDSRLRFINEYLHEENRKNGDRWKTIEDGISVSLFVNSETKEIIQETLLTDMERRIAEDRFLKAMTMEQIASDVGIERRTATKQVKRVSMKLKKTFRKMCLDKKIEPKI